MKRTLCIITAMLVAVGGFLAFTARPASAVFNGGDSIPYSPIHFDYYILGTGSSTVINAWDGNTYPWSGSVNSVSASELYYLEQFSNPDAIQGHYLNAYYLGYPDFRLYANQQVFVMSSLPPVTFDFGLDSECVYEVSIDFNLCYWNQANSYWALHERPVTLVIRNDEMDCLWLGKEIYDAIREYTSDELVMVTNLDISFRCIKGLEDYPQGMHISFYANPVYKSPADMSYEWHNSIPMNNQIIVQEVVIDETGENFLGWMLGAIKGFLNTPIIGDFSIGGLAVICVSISCAILIAKLLG